MNNRYVTLQAAGKLKITDKGILSSLMRLASDDNSWKVKAHTIKGEHYRAIKPRTGIAVHFSFSMSVTTALTGAQADIRNSVPLFLWVQNDYVVQK